MIIKKLCKIKTRLHTREGMDTYPFGLSIMLNGVCCATSLHETEEQTREIQKWVERSDPEYEVSFIIHRVLFMLSKYQVSFLLKNGLLFNYALYFDTEKEALQFIEGI